MAYVSPTLTLMVEAVKKTASAVGRDFNELEHLQTSVHSDGTFAKHSYDKVLKVLHDEFAKFKPDLPLFVAGTNTAPENGSYFAVSPLAGFANFAHGNADFAVSVALIANNTVIDAVVYSPIRDELFFAEKGCGAFKEGFRNHERLRVSAAKNAEKAIIACNAESKVIAGALTVSKNVRISGVCALDLAYLAAGKIDAVAVADEHLSDIAAGILLVKEAGGYVFELGQTDVRSENLAQVLKSGSLLATNEALRQKLAVALAK